MDWNRVEGNWKQMKGKIKEKWGDLTDGYLEKLFSIPIACGRGVNVNESERERSGIICGQFCGVG